MEVVNSNFLNDSGQSEISSVVNELRIFGAPRPSTNMNYPYYYDNYSKVLTIHSLGFDWTKDSRFEVALFDEAP